MTKPEAAAGAPSPSPAERRRRGAPPPDAILLHILSASQLLSAGRAFVTLKAHGEHPLLDRRRSKVVLGGGGEPVRPSALRSGLS